MPATNRACDALTVSTARFVAACVSRTRLAAKDVPLLVVAIHEALHAAADKSSGDATRSPPDTDWIVCLEDGLKFKSLKHHLRQSHRMTPAQYRAKWDLPADYRFTRSAHRKSLRAATDPKRPARPKPVAIAPRRGPFPAN